jgi:hypothetical protein
VGSLCSANTAAGWWQTCWSNVQSRWYIEHDGSHPPTLNSSEMAGLLNTSSCAPANLEAGDSEEIAQVDALLLMSDLQCVGQLRAPVHCWLYKLGLFHHPLLKLFHGLLYCVLYFCVHLWFMANSICDFKQTGLKGIRRRIWVSGIFVCSFCNFGFFFFLFFSFDSFAGLVEQCAWNLG